MSLLLDGPDLRHVQIGPLELVQRVYVAVRDAPWNTIPAEYSGWTFDEQPDRFRVAFHARHRYEAIDFEWNGTIEGTPDGAVRYEMDGVCHGTFRYSKIGFNVHHALDGAIRRPFRAQTETGELRGILSSEIEPQRIANGTLTGMFDAYSEIAIEVAEGVEAIVRLEGDLLELQDHRNWTDANFKSYGTPLTLGFPFDTADGQRIRQVLTITYAGSVPEGERPGDVEIIVGSVLPQGLPPIGLGTSSNGRRLSVREAALIREVRPAHLRVDVVLKEETWRDVLARAAADARSLDAKLELAVHANERSRPAIAALAAELVRIDVPVARVLVYYLVEGFSAMLSLTPPAVVRLVRDGLEPVVGPVVFAGGTNQSFADVNRDRPADPVMTGICFAMSPTVHAHDDASIVENIRGQAEVVEFARTFPGDRVVCVSPVTIATRFGPYPGGPAGPDDLPSPVDVRQASLLGAAWTAGSIAALARAGAGSVTYYETSGWRGIVEDDEGNAMPDRFPSRPGDAFPAYHVLADAAEWATGRLVETRTSDELRALALAIEDAAGRHLLVANVAPEPQEVTIHGLRPGPASLRVLDETTAPRAMEAPAAYRSARSGTTVGDDGTLVLPMRPYAVARLDLLD